MDLRRQKKKKLKQTKLNKSCVHAHLHYPHNSHKMCYYSIFTFKSSVRCILAEKAENMTRLLKLLQRTPTHVL